MANQVGLLTPIKDLQVSGWTVSTAGTAWQALSDGTDTTYLTEASTPPNCILQEQMSTLSYGGVASSEIQIRSVRARVRYRTTGGQIPILASLSNGVTWSGSIVLPFAGLTAGNVDTQSWLLDPNNVAWTPDSVNSLILNLSTVASAGLYVIYEVWLVVEYNRAPKAAAIISGTPTDRTRANIQYTVSDDEGDQQAAVQIKLYDFASPPVAGNPDLGGGTQLVDTGVLLTPSNSVLVPYDMQPATNYSAFIKLSDVGSNLRWGPWQSNTVAVGITDVPTVASFTATADNPGARVALALGTVLNLLTRDQADAETGGTGVIGLLNCTVGKSGAVASHGANSWQMAATANGTMQLATTGGINGAPVNALATYTIMAQIRSNSFARTCRVGVEWFDAGGGSLSTAFSSTAGDVTTGWTAFSFNAVAPAGAAYARLIMEVQGNVATEKHFVDQLGIIPGSGQPWSNGTSNATWVIDYSDDGGTTWNSHRLTGTTIGPNQSVTLYDYESKSGIARSYRAKVLSTQAPGQFIGGPYSSTVTATVTISEWWMKVPQKPSLNLKLVDAMAQSQGKVGPALPSTSHESIGMFAPIGRTKRVPVYDTVLGGVLSIVLEFITKAAHDAFVAIRNNQQTILLQSPTGDQWYLRIQPDVGDDWMMSFNPQWWHIEFTAEEVDIP